MTLTQKLELHVNQQAAEPVERCAAAAGQIRLKQELLSIAPDFVEGNFLLAAAQGDVPDQLATAARDVLVVRIFGPIEPIEPPARAFIVGRELELQRDPDAAIDH